MGGSIHFALRWQLMNENAVDGLLRNVDIGQSGC